MNPGKAAPRNCKASAGGGCDSQYAVASINAEMSMKSLYKEETN
jgi:hypothetical protein